MARRRTVGICRAGDWPGATYTSQREVATPGGNSNHISLIDNFARHPWWRVLEFVLVMDGRLTEASGALALISKSGQALQFGSGRCEGIATASRSYGEEEAPIYV